MSQLFDYLIKASLCLGIVYLFYYFVLRPLTHYNWNRYFLLLAPVLAFVIPLLKADVLVAGQPADAVVFIRQFTFVPGTTITRTAGEARTGLELWQVLLPVFITGVLFLLARLCMQLYTLKKIRNTAVYVQEGSHGFYHLEGDHSPFSFGGYVYLNRSLYNQVEFEKIIRHEKVHVQQRHTIDVLLMEILCIVNWFNPFAWFVKHAAKQNLEFIADEMVLQGGCNRKGYQYLLLKVARETQGLNFANNFLFPSLKKRIEMMNKDRTGKVHLLKFVIVLPLLGILLVAFGETQKNNPPYREHVPAGTEDQYSLTTITYRINDARAETIVKEDRKNSLLKPGGTLSLGLISKERDRLRSLLVKNGYNNLDNNAIRFTIDTTLTKERFAVEIAINISEQKLSAASKTTAGATTASLAVNDKTKWLRGNENNEKLKDQTRLKQVKIVAPVAAKQ